MPSKTKLKNAAIAAKSATLPKIPKELIDQFITGPMTGEAVDAASMAFKKALIERAMGAELGHHLGYPAGAAKPDAATNQRNGKSAKTVLTGEGPVRIEVPRDRDGSFEPILIPKHERRFTGFDEHIIAMYARGMTMREIRGFLLECYGTEVSAEFISSVTEAVMAEVIGLAGQAAGADVSGGLLRRLACEDQGRRSGAQQSHLPGPGRAARRHARHPGPADRGHGGCQILDEGVQRPQDRACSNEV